MLVKDEALLCGAVNAIRLRNSNRCIEFVSGRLTFYMGLKCLFVPSDDFRRMFRSLLVVAHKLKKTAALSRFECVADRIHLVSPLDCELVLLYYLTP